MARQRKPIIRKEDALLADRNITALSMDSNGRLWIGYFDRGLQILDSGGARGEFIRRRSSVLRESHRARRRRAASPRSPPRTAW